MTRPAPRGRGAQAVGAWLPRVARVVFESHGFPSAAIVSEWPAIVGAELASFTAPERLNWPRRLGDHQSEDQTGPRGHGRQPRGATLVLRVDGPRAIEIQHESRNILERINTYFGYRAVTALRIIQGPVLRREPAEPMKQHDQPPAAGPELERIEDGGLRTALARLAARIE